MVRTWVLHADVNWTPLLMVNLLCFKENLADLERGHVLQNGACGMVVAFDRNFLERTTSNTQDVVDDILHPVRM